MCVHSVSERERGLRGGGGGFRTSQIGSQNDGKIKLFEKYMPQYHLYGNGG